MSETQQEGRVFGAGEAPAAPDVDPANVVGPGVTQNPADVADVQEVARIAEENARLRAQLISENERLKSAIADSQAAGLSFQGLSDEDVRRAEHPEEFTDEYAARGEHDALTARLDTLQDQLVRAEGEIARINSGQALPATANLSSRGNPSEPGLTGNVDTGGTTVPGTTGDLASLSDDELQAELSRRARGGGTPGPSA